MPSARKDYSGVQVLRGLAAMLVVLFHAGVLADERFGDPGHHLFGPLFRAGAGGVDVFFPICGFVMVVSTVGWLAQPSAWRIFLTRRIIRIVPLYWIATTLKLIVVLAVPALALHTAISTGYVASSYFFIFAANPAGVVAPLLPVAWTLIFEMFFYGCFAMAMLLHLSPIRMLAIVMGLVAVAGFFSSPLWPAPLHLIDPIVLEFVAGMVVAYWALAGRALPPIAAGALASLALLALFATDLGVDPGTLRVRFLLWGLPGVALLAAAVSLEQWVARGFRLPRLLGDASYAIYISQAFTLPVVAIALSKADLTGPLGAATALVAATVACAAVGVLVYRWVERPITRYLGGLVRARTKRGPRYTGLAASDAAGVP
ncbi:MAG: acyltransferase family protein [Stellaceae bacterium]